MPNFLKTGYSSTVGLVSLLPHKKIMTYLSIDQGKGKKSKGIEPLRLVSFQLIMCVYII